jgi:purine catabolism regulator
VAPGSDPVNGAASRVLTLAELLDDLGLPLIGGRAAAERPLRWVHISELPDPTPWLSGGELLLTTGMQMSTATAWRAFVERLADAGVAGLGLGTGFAHATLPADLLEVAERRGVPVFEVPYEVPFIAITEKAFTRLVGEDQERRLAASVLDGLVAGDLAGAELEHRLAPFAIGPRAACLVLTGPAQNGNGNGNGSARGAAAALSTELAAACQAEGTSALVAGHGQLLCALIDAGDSDELVDLAERMRRGLTGVAGGEGLRAGVGRPVPTGELRRSFHEARCALEAVELVHDGAPSERTATYRDLGSFQLLLALQGSDTLQLFCDSLLGPIEAVDHGYGDELLRSLEVFIEENGQWERAARRLYCHRHTLRYRIRRIEELTERDLSRARERIEFWLALRGRELL